MIHRRIDKTTNCTRLANNHVSYNSQKDADDPGVYHDQQDERLSAIFDTLRRMWKTINKVLGSSKKSEKLKRQILKLTTISTYKKIRSTREGDYGKLGQKETTNLMEQTLAIITNVLESSRKLSSSYNKRYVPLGILLTNM